jgi:thiol:disulfide interchange protein
VRALGPALGSRGLPTTVFHDAQGRRVDAHMGVLNAAALQARLRRLQDR